MVLQKRKSTTQDTVPPAVSSPDSAAAKDLVTEVTYEWGGPVGAFVLMCILPFVIYMLYFFCPNGGDTCGSLPNIMQHIAQLAPDFEALVNYEKFNASDLRDAYVVALAWFAFQASLERLLPGPEVDGVKLKDGTHLKYRLNGHKAFWVTLLVMFYGKPQLDEHGSFVGFTSFKLSWCYDHYLELVTACLTYALIMSFLVYAASFRRGAMLAEGGNTGNVVYDFFIGRELNPRFPGTTFDVKFFCELRPGLIGWVVLNLGMAQKQYELTGAVSWEMIAVNAFQALYVWDSLFNERAVLTTMDITTDGFGYMLAFGDLCWVPFTYGMQARYLVTHDGINVVALAVVTAMAIFGYCVFRGSNGEKDRFRRAPDSPECAHLESIQTKRGTRLLVSGWWGMARKVNYTGDWIMGLSWSLTTGFNTLITYFYPIYFAILLVHRASRDDEMCQHKYGDDWITYKKRVPYVFLPGIF
eukprot:m.141328 g.141328  ORF g.141328 m.141328 type:complete len:470 (-) comp30181_c0_seq1:33-1442(-)